MNPRKIGILIGFLTSFTVAHGYEPEGGLATLTRTLRALSDALHKETAEGRFTPETMASLKDFAHLHGISDLNDALKLALSSAKSAKIEEPLIPGLACPVPPPPPAPPISEIKTGITITKKPKPVTQQQPGVPPPPSQMQLLAGRRGLRSTSEGTALIASGEIELGYSAGYSAEQRKQSDEQFLNAFRNAHSIADVQQFLRDLKRNPDYLKKEDLKKQKKLAGKPHTPYDVSIVELLKKKSLLSIKQIYSGSPYLKKYLFDPDRFTAQDSELLNNLMKVETRIKN